MNGETIKSPENNPGDVPEPIEASEAAASGQVSARQAEAAASEAPDPIEIKTHELSTGETLRMNIAGFTILTIICERARGVDGWIEETGHNKGIFAGLDDELNTGTDLAKDAVGLLKSEELIETEELPSAGGRITRTVNARIKEKGARALQELSTEYKAIERIRDGPTQREIVRDMLDELINAYNIAQTDVPPILTRLRDTSHKIETEKLSQIIEVLEGMQRKAFSQLANQEIDRNMSVHDYFG